MQSDRFNHETAHMGEFRRRMVRHLLCHSCGYEPPRGTARDRCPKCGGGCWERFVQMGKLRADPPACRAAVARPAPGGSRASNSPAAPSALANN